VEWLKVKALSSTPSTAKKKKNIFRNPISKVPNTIRTGGVAQGVGPEFKPKIKTLLGAGGSCL
jgi:hypothetical protein